MKAVAIYPVRTQTWTAFWNIWPAYFHPRPAQWPSLPKDCSVSNIHHKQNSIRASLTHRHQAGARPRRGSDVVPPPPQSCDAPPQFAALAPALDPICRSTSCGIRAASRALFPAYGTQAALSRVRTLSPLPGHGIFSRWLHTAERCSAVCSCGGPVLAWASPLRRDSCPLHCHARLSVRRGAFRAGRYGCEAAICAGPSTQEFEEKPSQHFASRADQGA